MTERFWIAFPEGTFEKQALGLDVSGYPLVAVDDTVIVVSRDANEVIGVVESCTWNCAHLIIAQCDLPEGMALSLLKAFVTEIHSSSSSSSNLPMVRVRHSFITRGLS